MCFALGLERKALAHKELRRFRVAPKSQFETARDSLKSKPHAAPNAVPMIFLEVEKGLLRNCESVVATFKCG